MRANKLRELLKANKPTLSTHIHTTWPSVVEAIGHTGLYDYVEFVGEYGPFDLHDLDNLARAGDIYNMSMQLKVDQEPRGFLAQRAIGSGFHSILFADCRSAADVQECVRIVRAETPEDKGTYGVATRRFTYMGYGGTKEYVQALRDIVVAIMIEKPGTVDTLEDVLAVKGVDMVQWGGSDYSMGMGRPGERYSPELRVVERRVFETAIKMGVPPRAEIATADQAKYFLDMGVRHFSVGTDITVLHQWWKSQGEDMRKALGHDRRRARRLYKEANVENKVVQDVVVAPDENWSAVLTPGQVLRIVDLEGKQAVDFLCYNADDPADRYNAADTMKYNKNVYLGAGHGIYTVRATKLFTIVADTMGGGHDTIGGCCSAASNMFRYKVPDTPSCYANFLRALARHGMGEKDIVANINFFMNVPVLADGTMGIVDGKSKPEIPWSSVPRRAFSQWSRTARRCTTHATGSTPRRSAWWSPIPRGTGSRHNQGALCQHC